VPINKGIILAQARNLYYNPGMCADVSSFSSHFLRAVGQPLQAGLPLARHSSFQIGGPADYFFEARKTEELVRALALARREGVPYHVIGGGTNLLFDDRGFRGLIIKNGIKEIRLCEDDVLAVQSGSTLKEFLQFCVEKKRQGLEFLAGIPGTVGGAVYGNAGAFGQCIGSFLFDVRLLSLSGRTLTRPAEEMEFSYRDSLLKRSGDILLEARFRLKEGDPEVMRRTMSEHIAGREKKHPPYTVASAGSYFKNPFPPRKQAAAAVLLEKAGAKELKHGGASVSPIHANFIVNTGHATAADVRALAEELKERVRKRFGVELEEEVIYLPADSSGP